MSLRSWNIAPLAARAALFRLVGARLVGAGLVGGGLVGGGLLGGCATKQVAVAPPPPAVVIPPQPAPPLGAPVNLSIPPVNAMGMRQTVNAGITPAQTVWNLRSAYNVAALNCMRPEHAAILEGYKAFLKSNAKRLTAVNKEVDKEFRAAKGKTFVRARESYMTQVYNFYALPPTLPAFCDAALAMSARLASLKASELDGFAATNLPQIDTVFLQFYDSYDQYRADLAAWQQRYAPVTPLAGAPAAPVGPAMAPAPALTQAAPQGPGATAAN